MASSPRSASGSATRTRARHRREGSGSGPARSDPTDYASRSAMRRTPSTEVVVAERERQPGVAGRAERLAGNDRDLGLLEQHLAELERGRAACGRAISRPSTPSNDGKQ